MKTVSIIGTGLIGGSVAKDLRKASPDINIIGVEQNHENAARALALKIVDQVLPLHEAVEQSDVVLLAVPVSTIGELLPIVLDQLPPQAVAIDLGSTKSKLCRVVQHHPNRHQYVAAHPIAGTENSGPEAALEGLFKEKINIICEKDKSSINALSSALELFNLLNMTTIFMEPEDHDKHLAYISHLSHISSFVLSMTVLNIEKEEKNIFALAGSGFASTVRLAKSSPAMWAPIFEQNAHFLNLALEQYIAHLQQFQQYLQRRDSGKLHEIMNDANRIRTVLDGMNHPIPTK